MGMVAIVGMVGMEPMCPLSLPIMHCKLGPKACPKLLEMDELRIVPDGETEGDCSSLPALILNAVIEVDGEDGAMAMVRGEINSRENALCGEVATLLRSRCFEDNEFIELEFR